MPEERHSSVRYKRYQVAPRKAKSRLWLRIVRWTVIVVIAAVAFVVGGWVGWFNAQAQQLEGNNPEVVQEVRKELVPQLPGEAMNILVMGSDHRYGSGGDSGRSDTLMLLRLDPKTKSVSILSVPRDLNVAIPGHGSDRINAAYSLGGPRLSVETFKALTGLPVNDYMEVDFVGFSNIVDALGGVYLDVDRRYYNPPDQGWAAIDIKAGYQKLDGHDALQYARFRHTDSDFTRMVRQQTIVRELQRQSFRWGNWKRIPDLVKIITRNTTSNLSSLREWASLARLVLEIDTSKVYSTHLIADPYTVGEASELKASPDQISAVVEQFTHPDKPPIQPAPGKTMPRKSFTVSVSNGGAAAGTAGTVAAGLKGEGYRTVVAGDLLPSGDSPETVIYATRSYFNNARAIAALMKPSKVVELQRARGGVEGVSVVLGPAYAGLATSGNNKPHNEEYGQQVTAGVNHDAAVWKQFSTGTPVKAQMPSAWVSGCSYVWEDSRKYRIPTGDGDAAALCVVGQTASGKSWHIQEMRWTDPPAVASPNETVTIQGRDYQLFYSGSQLHRVAWQDGGTLYWLSNTLEDDLSKETMLALAASFKPVK
jgi:LCP family protein required for cell wall assembly